MKRVAVLLSVAATMASQGAFAQLPIPPASEGAEPGAAAGAPAAPAEASAQQGPPGDQYYVEQPPPAPAAPPAPPAAATRPEEPPPFEPPPPGGFGLVPPFLPRERHLAPERSFYVGARLGWFFPFGNAWARARPVSTKAGSGYLLEGVPWRDYATSGPMVEVNVGVRLARSYALFVLWERAQLGSGNSHDDGEPDGAESDFWAGGLRASSNPDGLAFVTEVAVGYRRARSFYKGGTEVQFTDAPFEARLGLGAELRTSRLASWSGLVTVGVGGFGEVRVVAPNGAALPKNRPEDAGDGHAWVTLNVGGHFDFFPTED